MPVLGFLALRDTETPILTQKRHPYTRNLLAPAAM